MTPETWAEKHKHMFSWIDNKELISETKRYIKSQGDNKWSNLKNK